MVCDILTVAMFLHLMAEEQDFPSHGIFVEMGKLRPFEKKGGLNEDHFNSLVLMRNKSSIEDLYASTISHLELPLEAMTTPLLQCSLVVHDMCTLV